MSNRHAKRASQDRKGIGLYTYEQEKGTTPFQYFGQIVVGATITALGVLFVYSRIGVRAEEIRKYGSPDAHIWDWLCSFAVVVIGVFMAHAGVIFYFRRILRAVAGRRRKH